MIQAEHPDVTRLLRLGVPVQKDPLCPLCGAAPEVFYFGWDGVVLGCEACVQAREYWKL